MSTLTMKQKGRLVLNARKIHKYYVQDRFSHNPFIERLESFYRNYYITIVTNVDNYVMGNRPRSRLIMVILSRVALLLHTLRFGLSALMNRDSVRTALMDFGYLLGEPFMISCSVTAVSLAVLCIGLTILYQELTHTYYFADLAYMIKHNSMKYPLNSVDFVKLAEKADILSRLLLRPAFYLLVASHSITHLKLSIDFYLTLEERVYSTIGLVFYNILFFIFSVQCFAYLWVGLFIWFASTQLLRYKFIEINDKIELSLKQSNVNRLISAIIEHNYIEVLTKRLDHFFRVMIFIIYYIATIGFQIILFVVHNPKSTPTGRIIDAFIFCTCFWAVVMMNIMSTKIITAAHKPYSRLYSFITNKTIRMTFRQRWKLLSFMEKLSGRQIGFYCYDLFPMNNWEFYQYLYISGLNYFLIMKLF